MFYLRLLDKNLDLTLNYPELVGLLSLEKNILEKSGHRLAAFSTQNTWPNIKNVPTLDLKNPVCNVLNVK